MGKWQIRNLENLNIRNITPSLLISEFSILPYSKNRKFGFKKTSEKLSEISKLLA